jgi:hypothetical protein
MGLNTVAVPKFQNGQLSSTACWADDAGIAHDIGSYARVQLAGMAQGQTSWLQ